MNALDGWRALPGMTGGSRGVGALVYSATRFGWIGVGRGDELFWHPKYGRANWFAIINSAPCFSESIPTTPP